MKTERVNEIKGKRGHRWASTNKLKLVVYLLNHKKTRQVMCRTIVASFLSTYLKIRNGVRASKVSQVNLTSK